MTIKNIIIMTVRWVGRIFLILFLIFLVLLVFGFVREVGVRKKYSFEYPPPGQMVDIGTHSLHLNCMGSGSPTVVFESDLDVIGSLSWSLVQSEVAQFTRTITYDRAGILWSESGPHPRDGEMIANELGAVLNMAGEVGPYVLVGHALGGAYVRIFAGQNPDAVCGMVLVDSSHPDQLTRFTEIGIKKKIPEKQIRPLILLLSHLGMPGRYKGPQYSMPQEVYDVEQAFLPKSSMAWFDESVEGPKTLTQSGQYDNLGKMPLIVLSSARPAADFIEGEGQDPQEIWLELQHELTLLSENSEIRTYSESGHYIQFDRPEVVVKAISDIVQCCRENSLVH